MGSTKLGLMAAARRLAARVAFWPSMSHSEPLSSNSESNPIKAPAENNTKIRVITQWSDSVHRGDKTVPIGFDE